MANKNVFIYYRTYVYINTSVQFDYADTQPGRHCMLGRFLNFAFNYFFHLIQHSNYLMILFISYKQIRKSAEVFNANHLRSFIKRFKSSTRRLPKSGPFGMHKTTFSGFSAFALMKILKTDR